MKVIGAGLPRTGTMSMQAALEQLGYPCYHMETVGRTPSHLKAWDEFTAGQSPLNWSEIFADFEATVDAPACFYYAELMERYPDAKVILTTRDPHRWYLSVMKLYHLTKRLRFMGMFVPQLGRFVRFTLRLMEGFTGEQPIEDESAAQRFFAQHNQAVINHVPADRLLIFEVKDGWEPLCAFLGHDVPDIPFPHLNSGVDTIKEKIQERFLPSSLQKAGIAILAAALLGRLWLTFFA